MSRFRKKVTEVFVQKVAISDHYPICFIRCTSKRQFKRHDHKEIQYRCFRQFNEERFCSDLTEAMTTLHVSHTGPNHNFSNWSEIFVDSLNKHAPVKSKRVKRETQPDWLNEEIKPAIRTRDAYHKHKNWSQNKIWRNKTTTFICKAKKELFSKSIAENKTNSFL